MRLQLARMRELYGAQRIKHILLLPQHRIAYVAIPKAGCSSLKLYFERVFQDDPDLAVPNIHKNLTVPNAEDLLPADLRAMEQDRPFFGFSIVRDPMRRAVSAYLDKMREYHFQSQINAALGRKNLAKKVSFDDFLAALEHQTSRQMNPHWRPQADLLMIDALDYDHIGKLENLRAELDHICDMSNLPRLDMPHQNRIKASQEMTPTPEQKTRILKIYEKDFELLGY